MVISATSCREEFLMKWEFKGFYSKALESLRLPNNVQIISPAMSYKRCVIVGLLLEETNLLSEGAGCPQSAVPCSV